MSEIIELALRVKGPARPINRSPMLIEALMADMRALGVIGPSADPSVIVSHLCSRPIPSAVAGTGGDDAHG